MKRLLCIFFALALAMAPALMLGCALAEGSPGVTLPAIDLTPLFQAVIALLAAVVTGRLIPWIKARTTAEQKSNIRALVKVLVYAAEQIYGAGNGKEKLEYVRMKLLEHGLNVETAEIEAAVGEYMNHAELHWVDETEVKVDDDNGLRPEDTPLEDWPLEMIVDFFRLNGIPCEGCQTKDEFIRAIKHAFKIEPPDDADDMPAEAERDDCTADNCEANG